MIEIVLLLAVLGSALAYITTPTRTTIHPPIVDDPNHIPKLLEDLRNTSVRTDRN